METNTTRRVYHCRMDCGHMRSITPKRRDLIKLGELILYCLKCDDFCEFQEFENWTDVRSSY